MVGQEVTKLGRAHYRTRVYLRKFSSRHVLNGEYRISCTHLDLYCLDPQLFLRLRLVSHRKQITDNNNGELL